MDEHGTPMTHIDDDTTVVLLKVEEAARRLRIGRTTCFALIRTGELESVLVGGLRRIPVDAPAAYVDRLRSTQHAA
ncbi:helix-turn-helix domain-containing protein [Streptomyces sp. NPDC005244]|uniref:helix-turn-helix domain-containing protein n=1 Tax=Streptomyces sp. NPDC005244 TaxID=3364708 RepID=UPI003677AD30